MNRLKAHFYSVGVKPIPMDIESDKSRQYADAEIGVIKPYGLGNILEDDIEIKEKIEDAVVQQHINQGIEQDDVRNQSPAPRRYRGNVKPKRMA